MPRLIPLRTYTDSRGSLTVIERELGFQAKRVFYIYNTDLPRGGHGHKKAKVGLVALAGEVNVLGQTPEKDFSFELKDPGLCLLLEPEDWHEMKFSKGSILLVLSSEEYNPEDYFYEKYRGTT